MQFSRALLFILTAVFLVLSFFGVLTLLQLARLRLAWYEAAQAMNQIKNFYLAHFPELEAAFRWREATLPLPWKADSLSFYMALEVSLVTGMTFAAAMFFFQYGLRFTAWLWPFTVLAGGLACCVCLFL